MGLVAPVEPVPLGELGRAHFAAIGGAGMSGIARIMLARGVTVSGCDSAASDQLDELSWLGAEVCVGHSPSHLQAADTELMRRLLARAALEHRSDDTADIIAQRLALYHEVTSPIVSWYRDRGILVSVDAMRSAYQVGREILTALEAMRPLLDDVPARARLPVDLTSLGDAFGATDPTAGPSG